MIGGYVVVVVLFGLSVWSIVAAARSEEPSRGRRLAQYASAFGLFLMACLLGLLFFSGVRPRLAHVCLGFGVAALLSAFDAKGSPRYRLIIGGVGMLIGAIRLW